MKIETHDLIKRYGSRTVVDHVNVEVEQGSIVGLLGPNGAGKTTTFYMIVGIIQPDEGDVTVDGRSISGMPIHQRHQFGIGYLPQEASIFRKMTVWDNLMSLLETRKDLSGKAKKRKSGSAAGGISYHPCQRHEGRCALRRRAAARGDRAFPHARSFLHPAG